MSDLNSFSFTGRLGKDAKMFTDKNGGAILRFSVANSTGWGDRKQTAWVGCALFGKQATALEPYLLAKAAVAITGEVSLREYTTEAGVKNTSLDCRVDRIALIGGKQDAQPAKSQAAQEAQDSFGGEASDDDSAPF